MRPGRWEIQLRADTPRSVTDQIEIVDVYDTLAPFGTLFVTPAWVDARDATPADIAERACYAGVYRSQAGRLGLSGPGIEAWLGDEDGKGAFDQYNHTAASFTTWMDDCRELLTGSHAVTKGTYWDPGGTFTWDSVDQIINREALTAVCRHFLTEWRLNPDLTFDAGPVDDMYGSGLAALWVAGEHGGRRPGVLLLSGDLDDTADMDDYIYAAMPYESAASWTSSARGSAPDITSPWGPATSHAQIYRRVSAQGTFGDLVAQAVGVLLVEPIVHTDLSLAVTNYNPADRLLGYQIGVFAPDRRIFDRSAVQQIVSGRAVWPAAKRVRAITWGLDDGMGVYLQLADNAVTQPTRGVVDLTRWVDLSGEPRTARFEVGEPVRSWAQALRVKYSDWDD